MPVQRKSTQGQAASEQELVYLCLSIDALVYLCLSIDELVYRSLRANGVSIHGAWSRVRILAAAAVHTLAASTRTTLAIDSPPPPPPPPSPPPPPPPRYRRRCQRAGDCLDSALALRLTQD